VRVGFGRRALRAVWGAATACLLLVSIAQADETEPALLALGLGYYDINLRDDEAADFRLEYRSDLALWIVKPWAGLEVTSDGAVYGLGGLLADIALGPRVRLTPSLGVGAYHDGGGKDLGHTVEFRSQIELAYRFEGGQRLGLAFGHISNASLGDDNPGTEILTLYYMIPLESLF
jgi:hypothetical protein